MKKGASPYGERLSRGGGKALAPAHLISMASELQQADAPQDGAYASPV